MNGNMLVEYEEENFEELFRKFLETNKLDEKWSDFVMDEYTDSLAGESERLYDQEMDRRMENSMDDSGFVN